MLRLSKKTILIVLIDINECYDGPCKNGAQCINNQGSFTCICPPDFTGPLCETGKMEILVNLVKLTCISIKLRKVNSVNSI